MRKVLVPSRLKSTLKNCVRTGGDLSTCPPSGVAALRFPVVMCTKSADGPSTELRRLAWVTLISVFLILSALPTLAQPGNTNSAACNFTTLAAFAGQGSAHGIGTLG